MAHQNVRVELGERSYDIVIGFGLLDECAALLAPITKGKRSLVVADQNFESKFFSTLATEFGVAAQIDDLDSIQVPSGESSKSVEQLGAIWDHLVDGRYTRNSVIIAMGGGVVGDLAGFAAATFLRGVDLVQVPTTLLAMVDSSVGGKTGINHPLGKNLLGAFWQPRLVIIDTNTLSTLPSEEVVSALAEIIKYGVIRDADFFAWLESNVAKILSLDEDALAHAIHRSCEIKAEVVGADERETSGLREILNFGHTVAHAIENAAGYGAIRHGEAVAIGMIAESRLGVGRKNWTEADHARLVKLIAAAGLPTRIPPSLSLSAEALFTAARSDKKNRGGSIRYMVPTKLGEVENVAFEDTVVAPILKELGAK